MAPTGELSILVPVDVSDDPPTLAILDVLGPMEIVLLGYFPVPDQAEPALIKDEYEEQASAVLSELADGRADVTEVLVFTHDESATIDRIADRYDCEAVLTGGDTDRVERILVPLRGDANLARITAVVAGLLEGSDATATFLHAVGEEGEASEGEALLTRAVQRVTETGIDAGRVEWQLSEGGDPGREIVAAGDSHDLVVFGETEPSLRERIIGDTLGAMIDRLDGPALVVRDVE